MSRCEFKLLLCLAVLLLSPASAGAQQKPAELVFTGGKVYTVDEQQPWAEAVAVTGRDIVFVGSSADAKLFIGDDTEVVDLEGRLMLPGLIDSHCHLRIGGQANSVMLNLFETMTEPAGVSAEVIRNHAKTLGEDDWVLGTGWSPSQFPKPTRQELDALVGGRKAMLADDTQHNGWYSTAALQYFGIDADTPNPKGGVIVREEDGKTPSGHLLEKAHMLAGFRQTPQLFTLAQQETAIKKGVSLQNEQGITSIIEAASMTREGGDDPYKRVAAMGELNLRVSINTVHFSPLDDEVNLKTIQGRPFQGTEMLDCRTVKWAIDGVPGTMAFMSEPYKDGTHPPANYDQDRLNREVDRYTEMGMRMMFHCEGDAGIDMTLKAMEYAHATGKPLGMDDRHIMTHLDHVQPDHIERMKKLNIIAQVQFHWAAATTYNQTTVFKNVRKELVDQMYPFTDLIDAGLHVGAGADWPTSPEWKPWELMQVGATRTMLDGEGGRFPGESLSVEQMVKAFTIEGAYAIWREDIIGSIEVGKRADLIVLANNIFEIKPEELSQTRVLLTLLNGNPVWGAKNFEKVQPTGESVEYGDYVPGHFCEFTLPGVWRPKKSESK
ncbi:N-substituted formamide deformylase precursor [Planctomycetes bacterium CA13]|uniref:N-substituted formamide deformylase n=1 Tax=Novipirellula herctigrandis TaxID=2527986 RepID=A0A5C5Z2V1_9BACT|nr:N-substituted formamide deformylase precursor [Planctomycetes bacterium CA13]